MEAGYKVGSGGEASAVNLGSGAGGRMQGTTAVAGKYPAPRLGCDACACSATGCCAMTAATQRYLRGSIGEISLSPRIGFHMRQPEGLQGLCHDVKLPAGPPHVVAQTQCIPHTTDPCRLARGRPRRPWSAPQLT